MIDLNLIPDQSSLLDGKLKEQLAGIFKKMEKPVVIKAVVDLEREKDAELSAFLKELVSLGEKLELELYASNETDLPSELNTDYLPVTGLYRDGAYGRVSFHGVPGGKEINSFVLAAYNLAGPGQGVSGGLKRKIGRLDKKSNIKICVSLACHHCPQVVAACQQIAILNPNIEAEMIDAALYDELVKKYKIERVPMVIVNDRDVYLGSKTMEEIVTLLK